MALPTTLALLVLKSRQVERLRQFYAFLGIAFTQERHGSGPEHHAATMGDVVFELYPLTAEANEEGPPRLGFYVTDLGQKLADLKKTGAVVEIEPRPSKWGMRAVVRDPDGRAVELYQVDDGAL